MESAGPPSSAPEQDARRVPELRPPAAAVRATGRGWGAHAGLLLIAAALGLAVAAVLWLPTLVAPPAPPTEAVPLASGAGPSPAEVTAPDDSRPEAEWNLQRYLKRRAELELLRAEAWAEKEMAVAAETARAGDRLFAERRFDAAEARYAEATSLLETLASTRPERLARTLDEAGKALEADDGVVAASRFAYALLLEPGLEEAEAGLARAEARTAVLERMNTGQLAELAGELDAAEAAYRAAHDLDPDYAGAIEAATRVASLREEREFGTAMSATLAALDSGRLDAAQGHLESAASLRPTDKAVTDARRRLAERRRSGELVRLRAAAEKQAAAEAWEEAGRLYHAALKIDPAAGFATAGVALAERRQRLNARMDHYLADPTRLHAPEPLAEAGRLLEEAAVSTRAEPGLAAKRTRLAGHVQAASTPRTVTLRSDGLTEVTLYHVGRFERFVEQRLQLLPGRYTVHGSRPGYRDVRVTFTIAADGTPAPVDVRCTEAL